MILPRKTHAEEAKNEVVPGSDEFLAAAGLKKKTVLNADGEYFDEAKEAGSWQDAWAQRAAKASKMSGDDILNAARGAGNVDASPAHNSVATTRRASGRVTSITSASAAVKPGRSSSVTSSAIGVTQSSGSGARTTPGVVLPPAGRGLGVRGSASASTSALGRDIHVETGERAGWKTGASGAASASSMSLATAPVAPRASTVSPSASRPRACSATRCTCRAGCSSRC